MADLETTLNELREEYAKTKHNKATNKHLGILRKKIANVKKEMSSSKKSRGIGFAVKKSGDATVVLVGFPNAGKSSLLSAITNAESRIAAYEFTTLDVIPGTMRYMGANIQILDIPGLIEGAGQGKGGGAKIASVIRVSDLLLIVLDITKPEGLYTLLDELYDLDIRINKPRPRINVERRLTGGLELESLGHKIPSKKEVQEILNGYGIYNGKVIFHQDADLFDLMEIMDNSIVNIRALIILNKIDSVTPGFTNAISREIEEKTGVRTVPISAAEKTNLEALRRIIFSELGLVRIYLKPKDGKADMEKPMVLRGNSTVMDLARRLHSKTANNLRYAYINGKSAKFPNQRQGREHILADEDIVTLVYEKV